MLSILKTFLKKNKYQHNIQEFEDLFLSHPNYPSLYSITDSLDVLGIENAAVRVGMEEYPDLPESFLAILSAPNEIDTLVLAFKTHDKITIQRTDGQIQELVFSAFQQLWTGIAVVVDPFTKRTPPTSSILQPAYYLLPIIPIAIIWHYQLTWLGIIFFCLSILGFLTGILIIQEAYGSPNPFASNICNFNAQTSCSSVIKSGKNYQSGFLGFADLPILYFSFCLFTFIIAPTNATGIVGPLSSLSIPVVLYSIWLQKFKIKKWCLLCLTVSLILCIQGILFVINAKTVWNPSPLVTSYIPPAIGLLVVLSIWLAFKPMYIQQHLGATENKGLLKFKRNYKLFDFLQVKTNYADNHYTEFKKLIIGNTKATHTLTLFLSPSCSHCHKAIEDAIKLTETHSDKIKVEVLFNVNNKNKENHFAEISELLLEISIQNPEQIEHALSDWHINKMTVTEFKQKWTIPISQSSIDEIQKQYTWCLSNGFNYAPVRLLNHLLIPHEYEITDIKYFLNDLSNN
jgi:uncharacterized membrane protein